MIGIKKEIEIKETIEKKNELFTIKFVIVPQKERTVTIIVE
jgi:hypothetical protein